MPKKIFCFVCLMAAAMVSYASGGVLQVSIKGADGKKGVWQVALYSADDAFLEKPFKTKKVAATGGETDVVFEDLPEGCYAVAIYLDENGNEKLDTNFIGFPQEPYGFSNNAKGGILGPPSFDKAKFALSGNDLSIRIVLT